MVEKMKKPLSIILPIYNGVHIISYTLSLLKEQVIRNRDKVDLVLCDNASTDNTLKILEDINIDNPFFSIVKYTEHVGIGESISRSIENATGEFVLLWSDDDIPSPTMIDTVLLYLAKYPQIELLHFNRLTGFTEGKYGIGSLKVYKDSIDPVGKLYENSEQFAIDHYQGMDFLSCDVIRKTAWEKGLAVYDKRHCGYEFIVPMLYGAKDAQNLFIEFPLCVHRASHRPRWVAKLPLYWLIGAPRMLVDMQKHGIIHDWCSVWKESYYYKRSYKSYLGVISHCLKDRKAYIPLLDEICSYQYSWIRRITTRVIVRFFPLPLYNWMEKKMFGPNYVKDGNGSYPLIP